MDSLRPCPFCGGEARTWKYSHPTLGEYWRVACDSDLSDCCISGRADTEAEAIAAWNTRYHSEFEETVIKAWKEIKDYQERTCKVEVRESAWGSYTRHCGNCGADLDCDTRNKQNYCPNCGAKVVGE